MPATFDGVEEKDLVACDPRCKKHTNGRVSPRVRRACARRIKLKLARQEAIARSLARHKPARASTSTSATPRPRPLGFVEHIDYLLARQPVPPASPRG
ncbi:hypothetical protein FRC09_009157 [Ceratobasidium sp. 395]|nr:hypothetical protein FRC09_009157 [Ceratobasidium sp. 395]